LSESATQELVSEQELKASEAEYIPFESETVTSEVKDSEALNDVNSETSKEVKLNE
jgi:hypothetical protein